MDWDKKERQHHSLTPITSPVSFSNFVAISVIPSPSTANPALCASRYKNRAQT